MACQQQGARLIATNNPNVQPTQKQWARTLNCQAAAHQLQLQVRLWPQVHELHLFSSCQLKALLLQDMQATWLLLNYTDVAPHAHQPALWQLTVLGEKKTQKLTVVACLKCITWLLMPAVCRVPIDA